MDLQLAGKGVVVTGGSKGTGLAVVKALLAEGAQVVAASRRISTELKDTEAVHIAVDLTTPQGAVALVDQAIAALGRIDVLVNNVGIGDTDELVKGAVLSLLDLSDADWQRTFDLHFYSALRVTRAALPELIENKGVVINVSSVGARLVSAGPAHYNVAKAALNALTKVIAEQFGDQGVRAITVAPGPIATGVWTDPDGFIGRLAQREGIAHDTFVQQMTETLGASTGRISTPAEVARLITFAVSPNNINGAEYIIDGGITKNV
ncbi:SDR family oxidoreductase [Nocardia abscessus]|uniref:SDR family oxidoreductase n=1 Tax=Nocardia abscessus TaxID=120957 RepID=A0ABS0CEL8_9NOCA|nr:SDR family NAD(P)-dependent oxidoreductase [Nocardia abscessus]MBF6228787.1 SDR family oxidoreductase [Nocardia abscessus]